MLPAMFIKQKSQEIVIHFDRVKAVNNIVVTGI